MDPSSMDFSSSPSSTEDVSNLLALARQRINEGNPCLALQAVVVALRMSGGEEVVMQTLARARGAYINRMHASAAADQLAALFAECAIAEASGGSPCTSLPLLRSQDFLQQEEVMQSDSHNTHPGESILAESGRMQVLMDASSDGSSFICLQCGALVSSLRKDEHMAYWCAKAPS